MLKVDLVSIPIKDQDRALEFYTTKLGFEVITDATFGEEMNWRWIELGTPEGARIALFTPMGQEDRVGTFSNVVFSSVEKDIHETYERLKKKGVEFVQPPKEESWGISALFKDSEGNVFCLSQKSN